MTRLVTLVVLTLALVSTQAESRSKRIHVTAEIVEATLIGDPTKPPQLGDQQITRVELFDEDHLPVGTGTGICTLVTQPGENALVQCFITAVFGEKGQIIFGGVAPFPVVGAVGHFAIFGGTGDFHKARGEATLVVLSPTLEDATFDIE